MPGPAVPRGIPFPQICPAGQLGEQTAPGKLVSAIVVLNAAPLSVVDAQPTFWVPLQAAFVIVSVDPTIATPSKPMTRPSDCAGFAAVPVHAPLFRKLDIGAICWVPASIADCPFPVPVPW